MADVGEPQQISITPTPSDKVFQPAPPGSGKPRIINAINKRISYFLLLLHYPFFPTEPKRRHGLFQINFIFG